MATLDAFRTASGDPLKLDFANDYVPDVRLNAGDVNGRTITVEIWDDGMPVDTDGLAATLAYNTNPGRGLGDRIAMTAVPNTETATYTVPVPRKALTRTGRILLGIELEFHGSKICSRNFDGIVERAVFDTQSPEIADTMGQLEKLIEAANTAASKADAAGDRAEKAANTATDATNVFKTAKIEYSQFSDALKQTIATMAANGVTIATDEDMRVAFDTYVAPALAAQGGPLDEDTINWFIDYMRED